MKRIAVALTGPAICAVCVLTILSSALSEDSPRITKDELRTWMDKGDVMVLDVRTAKDWQSSRYKIHGAIREDPADTASWAKKYDQDETLVLYCA